MLCFCKLFVFYPRNVFTSSLFFVWICSLEFSRETLQLPLVELKLVSWSRLVQKVRNRWMVREMNCPSMRQKKRHGVLERNVGGKREEKFSASCRYWGTSGRAELLLLWPWGKSLLWYRLYNKWKAHNRSPISKWLENPGVGKQPTFHCSRIFCP